MELSFLRQIKTTDWLKNRLDQKPKERKKNNKEKKFLYLSSD